MIVPASGWPRFHEEPNMKNDEEPHMKNDEELRNLAAITAASGVAGLVVGIFRGIVQERHGGGWGFVRGMVASITVAVLVSLMLHDTDLTTSKQAALIGLAAYVADDLLSGIVLLAQLFRTDPIGFMSNVWSSIRGGRPTKRDEDPK